MRYGIGLDIGIASVGSAIVLLDGNGEPNKIHRLASRIFDAAEVPKTGAPLAQERREKRGMRRRCRRKRHRKKRIRALICKSLDVDNDYIENIFAETGLSNIYQIRCEALDRALTKDESIRLLIHFSQRRGFLSNRKVDAASDNDEGALLSAVSENQKLMELKKYRTIGETLYRDDKFAEFKRNKGGDYTNTFSRADYKNEIETVFAAQREMGNSLFTEELEAGFKDIVFSQRSFDEGPGPGKDSIYSGNQIEKMLRKCTFEPDEYRAPKASFTFEYFNLQSKINALKIVSDSGKRSLTKEERDAVRDLAFSQKEITYSSVRKALKLSNQEMFNISYILSDDKKKKTGDENPFELRDSVEKKIKFNYMKAYHIFKKAYGEEYDTWDSEKRDIFAYVLTVFKTDSKIRDNLAENGFNEEEINIALTIPSFSKFGNLSCKAMRKMIPYLEEGYLYNEAAEKAGYNFKADDKCASMYLPTRAYIRPEHRKSPDQVEAPELGDITNPVVRRAVSQTIKVVNAIIREMGCSPTYVNIELARDLSKNHDERNRILKRNNDNKAQNERIMDELRKEFKFGNPRKSDLLKLKLWTEQQGRCMYSGEPIIRERLFEDNYAEIDHIVPYSISFDDSMANKVLVLAKENRDKGNRLPLEYLKGKDADDFRIRITTSTLKYRKKQNLLKEKLTKDDEEGFKQRNLVDTQYISRFMTKFIKKYLKFEGEPKVVSVAGGVTSYIRKRWGIKKIREDGDTHHAIDACVIACTTQGMVQRIALYSKYRETEYMDENGNYFDVDRKTGEVINRFPMPYPTFRKELEMLSSNDPRRILSEKPLPNYDGSEQLKPIFVSRMTNRKVTGQAHEETLRKPVIENGQNYVVQKVPLTSLKLDKNGEIENYYMPQSDRLLYEALKARLAEFGGKGEKAFTEPFYKPKSDGTQGPLVKKVKTIEKRSISVPLADGTAAADNGSMVRVDVFYVEGEGYYLVPIYVADTVKKELPNRAITRDRSYIDWKVMDDKKFIFSLYPNDLIKVTSKKDMKFSLVRNESTLPKEHTTKAEYVYYKKTSISTGSITVINHDKTYLINSLGVKTLLSIEKYEVDVLGNIHKVNKEKRMGF